ncbi:MAG: hypothetical protein QNJ55_26530 [Xenococcus sp. MO_188.B8]|nr:hypothetical protein [Xenococcus sp. MO_188.B8]
MQTLSTENSKSAMQTLSTENPELDPTENPELDPTENPELASYIPASLEELLTNNPADDDDFSKIYKIGKGLQAFTEGKVSDQCAFLDKIVGKPQITEGLNASSISYDFVDSQQQLHEKIAKKSGLEVNLGFFKVGHSSSTICEENISEHALNLIIHVTQIASGQYLALSSESDNYAPMAKELSGEGKEKDFYRNYGCRYINKVNRGFYVHILLTFQCSSKEEKEEKQRELQAKIVTENGSGSGEHDNNSDFNQLVQEYSGTFKVAHNIKSDLISDNEKLQNNKNLLAFFLTLAAEITKFDEKEASIVGFESNIYPSPAPDFDFYEKEVKIHQYEYKMLDCQENLNTIKYYDENKSMYKKPNDDLMDEQKYKRLIRDTQLLVEEWAKHPYTDRSESSDLEERMEGVQKIELERKEDINTIITAIRKSSIGTSDSKVSEEPNLFINDLEEGKLLPKLEASSHKKSNGIRLLGIALASEKLNPEELSIHYEARFCKAGKQSDKYYAKAENGEILCCQSRDNNWSDHLNQLKVYLTGNSANKYKIHLKGDFMKKDWEKQKDEKYEGQIETYVSDPKKEGNAAIISVNENWADLRSLNVWLKCTDTDQ